MASTDIADSDLLPIIGTDENVALRSSLTQALKAIGEARGALSLAETAIKDAMRLQEPAPPTPPLMQPEPEPTVVTPDATSESAIIVIDDNECERAAKIRRLNCRLFDSSTPTPMAGHGSPTLELGTGDAADEGDSADDDSD